VRADGDTLDAVVTAIGVELSSGIFAAQSQPARLERIAAIDEAYVARRSALGREWMARLGKIDRSKLNRDDSINHAIAEVTAMRLEREEDWYWRVHDPLGQGFFGMFGPTAYAGGWHLSVIGREMQRQLFEEPEDRDRYLALVQDIVGVVEAMAARLRGQRGRGIALSAVQVETAGRLARAAFDQLAAVLRVSPERGERIADMPAFERAVVNLVEGELRISFARLDEEISAMSDRPGGFGLGAQPQGATLYEELVSHYTTFPLSAEEVHARGRAKMDGVRLSMAQVRRDAGFSGDDQDFAAHLAGQAGWRAGGPQEIAARFGECLARAAAMRGRWFKALPATRCEAAPLPLALEGSMTFGFYQIGTPDGDPSRYLFNTRTVQAMGHARTAAFAFHELEPGHHIHLAGQAEDDRLPPMRRYNAFNAFNEGWAEYAAALAGEHGLYRTAEERFGRLMLEAMLTARLVVDTGVNARGWSLERAQAYLCEEGFLPPGEARSEAIRYACDLPGQALAYKLGDDYLLAARERLRAARGETFDVREFHELVLAPGARPLPLIGAAVDDAVAG
jgi:uncharacterized protein (DUF885 family)